ncbi:MAG: hypothetical protein JST39_21840 [Bacteroidetes bacterium]|nr:hypothetical protein [Bacteroidota bacterium]
MAQVKWIEDISKQGREKQKQFLRYFNHLLEQSIRLRALEGVSLTTVGAESSAGGVAISGLSLRNSLASMPEKEKDFAGRLNKLADINQQRAIIEELDKAAYYIERNANPKMLFHALTIKLYHIIADKSLILVN